jgi:LemA protein
MNIFLLLGAIFVLFLLICLFNYNSLVKFSNFISEAWSGINVQLKKRHDLIPNLVETVKGYSKHEKTLLEEITKYRSVAISSHSIEKKAQAEAGLTDTLKTLFAVAENYPDLKANSNFMALQEELRSIENDIQYARRYYNGVVRDYNNMVQRFPSNIVANFFNFTTKPYFELSSEHEAANPQVKF